MLPERKPVGPQARRPMRCTLDHIHLYTSDPDGAADWFAAHLGGEILRYNQSDGRPRVDVRFGEVYVYVSRPPKHLAEGDGTPPATGINHLGFEVEDVDAAIEKLRRDGVEVLVPPVTTRPGVRGAYVRGPENISIEIFRRDAIDRGP
jgi:catechol 2,3-dioxygenase-like lactoylglutathione lyase family enzyme